MGTDGGGTVDESVRRQPGSVRNARVSLTAGGVLVLLLCGAAVLVERSVEAEDVADGASPHPVPVGLLVPIGVVAAIGLAEIALAVLLRPGGRITRTLTYVVCGIVLLGCSAPLSLSLPTGGYRLGSPVLFVGMVTLLPHVLSVVFVSRNDARRPPAATLPMPSAPPPPGPPAPTTHPASSTDGRTSPAAPPTVPTDGLPSPAAPPTMSTDGLPSPAVWPVPPAAGSTWPAREVASRRPLAVRGAAILLLVATLLYLGRIVVEVCVVVIHGDPGGAAYLALNLSLATASTVALGCAAGWAALGARRGWASAPVVGFTLAAVSAVQFASAAAYHGGIAIGGSSVIEDGAPIPPAALRSLADLGAWLPGLLTPVFLVAAVLLSSHDARRWRILRSDPASAADPR